MQALDELVARWRKNPDSESTLALCAHLGRSPQSELMREVGNTAEAWHRENAAVMLSVGRMYLDAGLLAEAQASFVQAGKLAPSDSAPYRFLGEVLLRRGDAVRGEKALARAIKLGSHDADARLWHERAVLYSGLQQRKGLGAVAEQVARVVPKENSIPAPTLSPFEDPPSEQPSSPAAAQAPRGARRSRPPAGPARPTGPRRSSPPGANRRRPSRPPAAPAPGHAKSAPQETLMMGRSPVPLPGMAPPEHPPSPFHLSQSNSPRARVSQPLGTKLPNLLPRDFPERKLAATARNPALAEPAPRRFFPESAPPPAAVEPMNEPSQPASAQRAAGDAGVPPPALHLAEELPRSEATETDMFAVPASSHTRAAVPEPLSPRPDSGQPSADEVLRALEQVGLYEAKGGVVPAWEAPIPSAPRRVWALAAAVVVAAGMGLGGYRYASALQSDRLAQAQAIGARLATLLDSGSSRDLAATEGEFQRLFELDSRGREAALLWLKNRALHALIADEPAPGIESALERARAVGVEERDLVFGRIASALSTGDLPGAAQLVTLWDQRAKDDASYQLFVGAMLERAGNAQALERYQSAVALQPDFKLAHLLAARLALLQLGPEKARPVVDVASAHLGASAAEQILRGLAWASAPAGPASAPDAPDAEALRELPPLLRSTAYAVEAVRAHREGRADQVGPAFQRALGPTTEPVLAAWIGYQALEAGDVQAARSAALKAMELSALHGDSQALASRIALADGRLKEARDAGRGLDPRSQDALLLEVVSAYENLQPAETARLASGLPADARSSSTSLALRDGAKVMLGQLRAKPDTIRQLGNDAQVWGPLLALDLALDGGQLDTAEQLLQAHQKSADAASYVIRAARLRRYQGQSEAGLERVRLLLEQQGVTPRAAAESVLSLVDADRASAAATTLERLGDDAGALGPWLQALVDAAQGRGKVAAKALTGRALPGKGEPVLLQTTAFRSLVAAKDRRAKAYGAELARRFPQHPELKLAGR